MNSFNGYIRKIAFLGLLMIAAISVGASSTFASTTDTKPGKSTTARKAKTTKTKTKAKTKAKAKRKSKSKSKRKAKAKTKSHTTKKPVVKKTT